MVNYWDASPIIALLVGEPAAVSEVLYRKGEYERARFYIRRINNAADVASAQTLWLGARIENRIGNKKGVQDFGTQLRNRFPKSRELAAFERGQFDE